MKMMRLEQVGVGSGTDEGNAHVLQVNFINEHPIPLNMTLQKSFPVSVKRMIFTFRRQGLFINKQTHHIIELVYILAPFFRKNVLFLETGSTNWLKHGLVL